VLDVFGDEWDRWVGIIEMGKRRGKAWRGRKLLYGERPCELWRES
jgi:hypothetical protein